MSAKVQFHTNNLAGPARDSSASATGRDPLMVSLRRIQADAQQICSEAADIEDARFIAEHIADTCRRALANGAGGDPGPLPASQSSLPDGKGTGAGQIPDRALKAAARARLNHLSARELEIFTHLAEGRSAAEIAEVLSRSSKTINNHRTRILQKLGLKNATELVRLALHSGLVSV